MLLSCSSRLRSNATSRVFPADRPPLPTLQKHTVDQILTFTSGKGKATINGVDQEVKAGDLIIVPAGTQHQFINTGPTPLILYTVYSPAEHKPTSVHKDKAQGDQEEEDGIDVAPEWSQRSKKENEKLGLVDPED
jgi:mannose-6-phosphate isomerase-like protein (cupin superfamily)